VAIPPEARADYYAILNVPPDASVSAIRRSYRALAKKLHPDVNPETGAAERFAVLAEAYETLSDTQKRRDYDRALAKRERLESASAGGGTRSGHYSWSNIAAGGSRDAEGEPHDGLSEFDELYDTFFGGLSEADAPSKARRGGGPARAKPGSEKATPGKTTSKSGKRSGRSRGG
jgi:DnaJ-class molecular chaperone